MRLLKVKIQSAATNTGLASGGLTFKRESSCGISRPNAKPRTVMPNAKTTQCLVLK